MEIAWTLTLPATPSAAAAMDQERVYVPLRDGRLTAIDREQGAALWSRPALLVAPPVVEGAVVYILEAASLRALDAATGTDRWSIPLERLPIATLRIIDGWLLTVLEPGEVVAFRANGEPGWRRPLNAAVTHISATDGGGVVYVTCANGRFVALSLHDGTVLWEQNVPGRLSEPTVGTDRVYVGSTENWLYAFDADSGEIKWRARGGGDVIGAIADSGLVYVVSLDNVVRALNEGNGNQRWKQETATRPTFPPMARRGLVVVPGIAPAATVFNGRTGEVRGNLTVAQGNLLGPPLIDATLAPFRVAVVTLTREGVLEARRPVTLMFRESTPAGLQALPGRQLPREQLPH